MALLVYSDKCQYSYEVLNFIKTNPTLGPMLRYHNVSVQGRPKSEKITRVPTLVTSDGQILVGAEVKNWLESMIPSEVENWSPSGLATSTLDGEGPDDFFELESYGKSMQPMLTQELREKINRSVTDAYQLKNSGQ